MKAKPVIAGIALLLVLGAVGGGIWKWRQHDDAAAAKQAGGAPPSFVNTAIVETSTWQPTARLVGTVIAKRAITLSNEVTGVITEVGFKSGDTVDAGQVLIKLDTRTEQADLAAAEASERLATASIESAQADVRVAESNLSLARSNQKRFTDAATSNSVSASDIDRVNADVAKATADLERQRAAVVKAQADKDQSHARVDQIKVTISKKTLTSPFRARVGIRTVDPGQLLPEGTSIVSLTELTDEIYLDFAVPQEYAARIVPGMVVMASSKLLGGDSIPITVEGLDATVNPGTRNVRIRSSVKNPDFRLRPGMAIEVVVPTDPPVQCVTIPTTAVRRAAYGDHVFVLVPDESQGHMPGAMIAKQRMVKLGADMGEKQVVESGLQAGEKIAGDGSFKLMDGGVVMQSPPPGAPSGPPGAGGSPAGEPARGSASAKAEDEHK